MIGDPERARVYLEAARLAGVSDGQTEQLVEDALDAKLPNRKAALEARQESVKAYADAQIAASTTRNLAAALAGDRIGALHASLAAKSAAYESRAARGRTTRSPAACDWWRVASEHAQPRQAGEAAVGMTTAHRSPMEAARSSKSPYGSGWACRRRTRAAAAATTNSEGRAGGAGVCLRPAAQTSCYSTHPYGMTTSDVA